MWEKIREPPNVIKKLSYVILELHSVRIKSSNVGKIKGTTKCDKSTIKCNVGTAQYEDETVKCEKNKRTTKCDKRIVRCDIGTTQYEDESVKCEKKN